MRSSPSSDRVQTGSRMRWEPPSSNSSTPPDFNPKDRQVLRDALSTGSIMNSPKQPDPRSSPPPSVASQGHPSPSTPPPGLPRVESSGSRSSRSSSRLEGSKTKAMSKEGEPSLKSGRHLPTHRIEEIITAPRYFKPPSLKIFGTDAVSKSSQRILKRQWVEHSRKSVELDMYADLEKLGLEVGVASLIMAWEAVYEDGIAQTTWYFVPNDDSAKEHWLNTSGKGGRCPEKPERRTKTNYLFATVGRSLKRCENAGDFFQALVQAHLGWLNIYQAGHLHRDISLGNVLEDILPAHAKRWTVLPDFNFSPPVDELKHELEKLVSIGYSVGVDDGMIELQRRPSDQGDAEFEDVRKMLEFLKLDPVESVLPLGDASCAISDLNESLTSFALDRRCGFATDGDLAKNWKTFFARPSVESWDRERSGTRLFMSVSLLEADETYIHSPMDDLESFFHVAVNAVLNNEHIEYGPKEVKLQDKIGGDLAMREYATAALLELAENPFVLKYRKDLSPIVRATVPVLCDWQKELKALRGLWTGLGFRMTPFLEEELALKSQTGKEAVLSQIFKVMAVYWKTHWHEFAFRGVQCFLKVVAKHQATLATSPSFVTSQVPTQPGGK